MPTLLSQAPSRSLDQRLDALDRANRIRVQRAQLKRALDAFRNHPEMILKEDDIVAFRVNWDDNRDVL